jgi:MSHA biogenesis protein MshM
MLELILFHCICSLKYNLGYYCKVKKTMIDVEQDGGGGSPFQEDCNTARFFTGGGRGAVLDDIKAALTEQVDIVTLIGEEGSGKTMLCKMLQEQLGSTYKIIYLPQIVGSFEAIVRVAAQQCGVEYPAETNRADARRIFLDLTAALRSRGEGLLIVSDEAENMYLATLERLRKILDDVIVNGGGLQLLFAGRKNFRTSLEQLTLCDFNEVREKQFFLSTLDDNETWEYLNFCVQNLRGETTQEVFTREAAAKIASMGRGNLRLINVFAEESLKSSSADTSFLVLLDHVRDDGVEDALLPAPKSFLEQLPFPPKFLFAGIAISVLFLLVVFFAGVDEETSVVVEENVSLEEIVTIDVPKPIFDEAEVPPTSVVVDAVDGIANILTENPVVSEEAVVVNESPAPRYPVAISPVEIVEKKEVPAEVPLLAGKSKISPNKTKHIILQSERNGNTEPAKTVKPSFSVDPALANLVIAGDRWLAGKEMTSFSIQLMALQSEQAEENLKRILAESEYQKVLSKLVMLKRPSDPPVVLLFYGIYPNMAAARNARNNMPIFLRDRHPYPVSVRGAVEKARAE